MIPWEHLDTTPVPDGGSMQLWRRGDEYVLRVDGKDLMSSRVFGSEEALAEIPISRLQDPSSARILIGGLGMGFTAQAALQHTGNNAQIVIAEVVPGVVAWNRGPLAHLAGHPLDDPRTTVFEGDVRELIEAPTTGFDAILLDVDNGPDGLTRSANAWLYDAHGLNRTLSALRSGGFLAVWSAFEDPQFTKRLKNAGFRVEVVPVRARGKTRKGARHTVWLAQRRP